MMTQRTYGLYRFSLFINETQDNDFNGPSIITGEAHTNVGASFVLA